LCGLIAGVPACARTQARAVPPVAMLVPPPPPRVAIPVSLPEPVAEPEEPEPPPPAPDTTPRTRVEVPPARPAAERPSPSPPATAAAENNNAPVLQTTINVGALERRATWLLGEAEKMLERVNPAQLTVHARAQYDRARAYLRNGRNALQIKNFNYAEMNASKAARLARALIPG
jgi:hypothetical protein